MQSVLLLQLGSLVATYQAGRWASDSRRLCSLLNRVMHDVETQVPEFPFERWLGLELCRRLPAVKVTLPDGGLIAADA